MVEAMKEGVKTTAKKTMTSAEMLRDAGMRATPGRIELINLLVKEKEPLTIKEIQDRLVSHLDEVTLYRALEAFAEAGLVTQVDLQHGHAHFELTAARKHHHHLVCTDCGTVEDFVNDACESELALTAQKSHLFKKITSHSMEVFGLCRSCA